MVFEALLGKKEIESYIFLKYFIIEGFPWEEVHECVFVVFHELEELIEDIENNRNWLIPEIRYPEFYGAKAAKETEKKLDELENKLKENINLICEGMLNG